MTTKELMIGDYVLYKGKPCQVTFLTAKNIGNFVTEDGSDYKPTEDGESIQPIPLSPELLEKNGFERCVSSIRRVGAAAYPVCESNQFALPGKVDLRVEDRNIHGWTFYNLVLGEPDKKTAIHNLKYLHQIQHIFRLFGIEKEWTVGDQNV